LPFCAYDLAVFLDATKMATSAFASARKSSRRLGFMIPISTRNSSQKNVSSASSTTTPSFEMNSALERQSVKTATSLVESCFVVMQNFGNA
jgi:hypothetical protein